MKSAVLFFGLFAVSLLFSCGGGNSSSAETSEVSQQQLWDEMMVIHDEVMPAMGDIFKYSKELKTQLDTAALADELKAEVQATIDKLDKADDGMMDWMAELKHPEELANTMDEKAILEYLKAETEKIKVVKQDMQQSLEEGKKMIQKLTPVEGEE